MDESKGQNMMNYLMKTMHLLQSKHAIEKYNSYLPSDERVDADEIIQVMRTKKRKAETLIPEEKKE